MVDPEATNRAIAILMAWREDEKVLAAELLMNEPHPHQLICAMAGLALDGYETAETAGLNVRDHLSRLAMYVAAKAGERTGEGPRASGS